MAPEIGEPGFNVLEKAQYGLVWERKMRQNEKLFPLTGKIATCRRR